jgi:hypothetical protein
MLKFRCEKLFEERSERIFLDLRDGEFSAKSEGSDVRDQRLRSLRTKAANLRMRKYDEVQCAGVGGTAGPTVGGSENVRISTTMRHRCSSDNRFLKEGIGFRPSVNL